MSESSVPPECGCRTKSIKGSIVWCPLHAVAPELLEALKEVLNYAQDNGYYNPEVDKLIAKAEGMMP